MSTATGMRERHGGGALAEPQTLIHTNNSPNPVSMRVSSRLTLENLDPVAFLSWQVFMGGPLGHLLLKRRADAK